MQFRRQKSIIRMLLAEEKVKIDDINGLQKINDPAFTKNLHHYDKDLFCVWFALQ